MVLGVCCTTVSHAFERLYPIPENPEISGLINVLNTNEEVDEYTGRINMNVPIHTIEAGGVTIPINLNYSSDGIMVDEEASWVGLGWNLTGGGVVSQQILDKSDDIAWSSLDGSGYGTSWANDLTVNDPDTDRNIYGFMFWLRGLDFEAGSLDFNSGPPGLYDWGLKYIKSFNTPGFPQIGDTHFPFHTKDLNELENGTDFSPDIYSFSFPGRSGKFTAKSSAPDGVAGTQASFIDLKKSGLKIEKGDVFNLNPNGLNEGWTITDLNGVVYYFGEKNFVRKPLNRLSLSVPNEHRSQGIKSVSFQLSTIMATSGERVDYHYWRGLQQRIPHVSEKAEYQFGETFVVRGHQVPNSSGFMRPHYVQEISEAQASYLEKITYPGGMVLFGQMNRNDVDNGKALDQISIYSCDNSHDQGTCDLEKRYKLNYDYFVGDASTEFKDLTWFGNEDWVKEDMHIDLFKHRLKLLSVADVTVAGSSQLEHSFDYYEDEALPYKQSHCKDYWGYYKGCENDIVYMGETDSKYPLLPLLSNLKTSWVNDGPMVDHGLMAILVSDTDIDKQISLFSHTAEGRAYGVDREPNENHIKNGLLKSIKYPTGGVKKISYELNKYSKTAAEHESSFDARFADPNNRTVYKTHEVAVDVQAIIPGDSTFREKCFTLSGEKAIQIYVIESRYKNPLHDQGVISGENYHGSVTLRHPDGSIEYISENHWTTDDYSKTYYYNQVKPAGQYCIQTHFENGDNGDGQPPPGGLGPNSKAAAFARVIYKDVVSGTSNPLADDDYYRNKGPGVRVGLIEYYDKETDSKPEHYVKYDYLEGKLLTQPRFIAGRFQFTRYYHNRMIPGVGINTSITYDKAYGVGTLPIVMSSSDMSMNISNNFGYGKVAKYTGKNFFSMDNYPGSQVAADFAVRNYNMHFNTTKEVKHFHNEADQDVYYFSRPSYAPNLPDYKNGLLLKHEIYEVESSTVDSVIGVFGNPRFKVVDQTYRLDKDITYTYKSDPDTYEVIWGGSFALGWVDFIHAEPGGGVINLDEIDRIQQHFFPIRAESYKLESTRERDYDDTGNYTEKLQSYTYSPHFVDLVKTVDVTHSDGKSYKTVNRYPSDWTNGSFPVDMYNQHIQTPIIDSYTYETHSGNDLMISAQFNEYEEVADLFVPTKEYILRRNNLLSVSTFNQNFGIPSSTYFELENEYSWNTLVTDRSSNPRRNDNTIPKLAEIKKTGGTSESFLWGYDAILPIARVINASGNDFGYTGFEALDDQNLLSGVLSGNWELDGFINGLSSKTGRNSFTGGLYIGNLDVNKTYKVTLWDKSSDNTCPINSDADWVTVDTENGWVLKEMILENASSLLINASTCLVDDVRIHSTESLMETYTYNGVFGMSSYTDVNNFTSYYSYDALNRYTTLRDFDFNIIEHYKYNYTH